MSFCVIHHDRLDVRLSEENDGLDSGDAHYKGGLYSKIQRQLDEYIEWLALNGEQVLMTSTATAADVTAADISVFATTTFENNFHSNL